MRFIVQLNVEFSEYCLHHPKILFYSEMINDISVYMNRNYSVIEEVGEDHSE